MGPTWAPQGPLGPWALDAGGRLTTSYPNYSKKSSMIFPFSSQDSLDFLPRKRLQWRCPLAVWHDRQVDASHLRAFGSPCRVHLELHEREHKNKMVDDTSIPATLIGYDRDYPGRYKLLCRDPDDSRRGTVMYRRSVYFNENGALGDFCARPVEGAAHQEGDATGQEGDATEREGDSADQEGAGPTPDPCPMLTGE